MPAKKGYRTSFRRLQQYYPEKQVTTQDGWCDSAHPDDEGSSKPASTIQEW